MTTKTTAKDQKRRSMTGTVVTRVGDKTVGVVVPRVIVHPLYQKRRVKQVKYLAHDEKNEVKVGDRVKMEQTRPLSAHKRWVVVERIEKVAEVEVTEE